MTLTLDPIKARVEALTGQRCVVRGDQLEGACVVHEADGRYHDPSAGYSVGNNGEPVAFCHVGCDSVEMLKRLDIRTEKVRDDREGWPAPGDLSLYLERSHVELLKGNSEGAKAARRYLRSRGVVTGDLVRKYRLGFARPDDLPAPGFQYLRSRIIYAEPPFIVEGRAVPGLEAVTYKPERKAQPALHSRKRWWRVEQVDTSRPVIAVEGVMDVLALDRMVDGQAIATFGKGNVNVDSLRRLRARGLTELLVSLDRDATHQQWRRFLELSRKHGVKAVPMSGPPEGDWGDLLKVDDDGYYRIASKALTKAGER